MFPRSILVMLVLAAAACGEQALPTAPPLPASISEARAGSPAANREALARRMARALARAEFREYLSAALAASPHPEGKVGLATFLAASNGRGFRALAEAGDTEFVPTAEQREAERLEVYVPVPDHRSRWRGGADVMVGTIGDDDEAPVGFDLGARRVLLDRERPPDSPVLAVVPLEGAPGTLDRPVFAAAACQDGCDDGPAAVPGLYLTASHLRESFESWLKGSPEIEVLVLGQKGTTDSLTSYQCAGNGAAGASWFDQNELDWSGSALLFSQAQLDAFRAQHPGQATRLFFMEDDDGPCQLKANNLDLRQLLATVDSIVRGKAGGKDTTSSTIGKLYRNYTIAQKLFAAIASFLKTNDDLIGNAVEDVVTTERYPGYNWIIKGDNGRTNGYIKLEMR